MNITQRVLMYCAKAVEFDVPMSSDAEIGEAIRATFNQVSQSLSRLKAQGRVKIDADRRVLSVRLTQSDKEAFHWA